VRTEAPAGTIAPQTFSQWLNAAPAVRELGHRACLNRIRDIDPSIRAWAQVQAQSGVGSGPLAGIPFGAKDIIETQGLQTEYGSPIYQGRRGTRDAAIVGELRGRGAILLGKTQTTAFAYRTPAPTRNPRRPEHTPGGSSSGSAAAVAAGMVPLALGTQTLGSTLRPASYCGVTGFKPTYSLIPMDGVLPFAKSLDTLGFFTHTPADMLAFWGSIGHPVGLPEDVAIGVADPMPEVEPVMAVAFGNAIACLRRAGAAIESIDVSDSLTALNEAAVTVMCYEGARFHRQRYEEHGSRLADLADLVRQGLAMSDERYVEAQRRIADGKTRSSEWFKDTPVILVPAATGPAPRGLSSTGDARMNAPWTALGCPAISIPLPVGDDLPLGLQLTAAPGDDVGLLHTAVRLYTMLSNGRE
jgi:Asp-tRNA(Asn)/Glu-tRNA(Gln) amidotransferase A subunit family amidase